MWQHVGESFNVLLSFRNLGAHLNFSKAVNGSTLTNRLIKCCSSVARVSRLPHDYIQKASFILTATLSAGLYGCETTHVNEKWVGSLTSRISNTIAPNSNLKSNAIVFGMMGDNRDVDPTFQIFLRSCKLLRRICVKMPLIFRLLSDIFLKYSQAGYIGT